MYKEILGGGPAAQSASAIYIWSMRKSGTIFLNIFFNIYQKLLHGAAIKDADLVAGNFEVTLTEQLLRLGHCECPGLDLCTANPEQLAAWQAIPYSAYVPMTLGTSDYHYLDRCMHSKPGDVDRTFRVVFVFRNPLDQMISLYKHQHAFPADDARDPQAQIDPAALASFIFERGALDAYIKMFYPYHLVRQRFPANILFVPYEVLVQDRANTLIRIFEYLGLARDPVVFDRALALTALENLKQVEHRYRALLPQYVKRTGKHIHNGRVGLWRGLIQPAVRDAIERRLNQFGLSLSWFTLLPPELVPESQPEALAAPMAAPIKMAL